MSLCSPWQQRNNWACWCHGTPDSIWFIMFSNVFSMACPQVVLYFASHTIVSKLQVGKGNAPGDLFSRIFLAPLDPFWMFAKRLVTVMTVCWIIANYFLEWFAIMYWVQKFKFWGMWDAVSVLQAGQLPPDVMACRQQLLGHLSWGSPGTRQFWWLWWKSVKNIYNSLFRKKHNSNSIQWLEESLCKDLRV